MSEHVTTSEQHKKNCLQTIDIGHTGDKCICVTQNLNLPDKPIYIGMSNGFKTVLPNLITRKQARDLITVLEYALLQTQKD